MMLGAEKAVRDLLESTVIKVDKDVNGNLILTATPQEFWKLLLPLMSERGR